MGGKGIPEWAVQDDYPGAIQTFLDFVAAYPASPAAPDFLMNAARVTERAGNLEEAANTWERIADEYSASEHVPDALFLAGVTRFRLGDHAGALTTFQRDLLLSTQPEDKARAYLWIGKTQQQLGDGCVGASLLAAGTGRGPGGLLQPARPRHSHGTRCHSKRRPPST